MGNVPIEKLIKNYLDTAFDSEIIKALGIRNQ